MMRLCVNFKSADDRAQWEKVMKDRGNGFHVCFHESETVKDTNGNKSRIYRTFYTYESEFDRVGP